MVATPHDLGTIVGARKQSGVALSILWYVNWSVRSGDLDSRNLTSNHATESGQLMGHPELRG